MYIYFSPTRTTERPYTQPSEKTFRDSTTLRHVTVPWSVCLSVTFAYCAQTAEDTDRISFAYDSPISLPIMLKFGLHWLALSSLNFGPK